VQFLVVALVGLGFAGHHDEDQVGAFGKVGGKAGSVGGHGVTNRELVLVSLARN